MEYEIDIDFLRRELIDYFGTGIFNVSEMAPMELFHVKNASGQEIIRIARENGINLQNYIVKEE